MPPPNYYKVKEVGSDTYSGSKIRELAKENLLMTTALKIDSDFYDMVATLIRSELSKGKPKRDIVVKLRKKFDESLIKNVLKEIENEKNNDSKTAALKEHNDYFGWYEGSGSRHPSSHWSALKTQLMTKENPWTQEMVDSLDRASTSVVSHLAPPHSERTTKAKGLVLGYIQSGKTANFSASIAKAVDAGYKLIVVLAGMHNNLRKQTETRLRSELVNPHDGKTCTTLTGVDEKGDFKRKQTVSANSQLHRKDGFVLVVLKKNSSVLRNFNRWLEDANEEILKNCPALIIDDESDQASINTNKADKDPTAINSHIRNMIQQFSIVSYVGYTATPFANVFIDASVEEDIYPSDFLITLAKPATYYGPEELFGRYRVNGRDETDGLPVIRHVPDLEADNLRDMAKGKAELTSLPYSLQQAIKQYFIGGAIRLTRGHWKQHITMLIHVSHLVGSHTSISAMVKEYVEDMADNIEHNDETTYRSLLNIFNNDFVKTTRNITKSCDYDFDKVWKNLKRFTESVELITDNSQSSERLTFDRSYRDGAPLWGIIVGGNTLSRGLTVEGLTTSYFVRNTKMSDTLLQMGRWFGYRNGYVDLTRIFVPDQLFQNFHELSTVEQEIRDEITMMAENGEKPKHVALRIRKVPNMLITANNKSRNTELTEMSYRGTKIQTHQIIAHDEKIVMDNLIAVENVFKKVSSDIPRTPVPFKELSACHLYRGVSSEYIMQFLDEYTPALGNAKFNKQMLQDYISRTSRSYSWSLGMMSLKNGALIKCAGLEVIPVSRNAKIEYINSKGKMETTLRAVSTPGDELIDLFDQVPNSKDSVKELINPTNKETSSDVQLRKRHRPHNQPLMLVYPLKSHDDISPQDLEEMKKRTNSTYPLKSVNTVFAVSIVFPFEENYFGPELYIKNKSV